MKTNTASKVFVSLAAPLLALVALSLILTPTARAPCAAGDHHSLVHG